MERIFSSEIDSLPWNCMSAEASADRMPTLLVNTRSTIVRLRRTVLSSSLRRCRTARVTIFPEVSSFRRIQPRSAYRKMSNSRSRIFGSSEFKSTAPARLLPMSRTVFSFTCGFTSSAPKRPRCCSSLAIVAVSSALSAKLTASIVCSAAAPPTTGGGGLWKRATASPNATRSLWVNLTRPLMGFPLTAVPLRLPTSSRKKSLPSLAICAWRPDTVLSLSWTAESGWRPTSVTPSPKTNSVPEPVSQMSDAICLPSRTLTTKRRRSTLTRPTAATSPTPKIRKGEIRKQSTCSTVQTQGAGNRGWPAGRAGRGLRPDADRTSGAPSTSLFRISRLRVSGSGN